MSATQSDEVVTSITKTANSSKHTDIEGDGREQDTANL